ncbi:MAG: hypothetical protein KAS13_07960 [Candidatus Omnitrophica bacterium]|nr:hypothetical protein [Candidatus Omnitrophota bacterium]
MKKIFKNNKLVILLILELLIFMLIADSSFADKLKLGGLNLENNPVNKQLGQSMKISGTIFYFTTLEEPKLVFVTMTIADEINLPVEVSIVDEKIIDEEAQKRMQEWSFSATWDGDVPFAKSSSEVYNCLIEVSTDSEAVALVQKNIRVGVVTIIDSDSEEEKN